MTFKNDPIQGILFKKEPLLLQQKAAQRARLLRAADKTDPVFFNRLRNVKISKTRLSRRTPTSPLTDALTYEYVPVRNKVTTKKRIRFTVK